MTATVADLLPRDAETFEKAAGVAMTDTLPVPIRQIVDPAVTPLAFLPFLAAQESVDLWFEDWTEERKRAMVGDAVALAALKGTREGAVRFLAYVDAVMVDVVAYPAKFIMNYAVIGRTPIGHGPFLANYLIKVDMRKEPGAFVIGRSALKHAYLKRPSREKFDRALIALRVAKGPETEVRVDFAHMRQLQIEDGPVLDDDLYELGAFVERNATPPLSQIWNGTNRADFSDASESQYVALFEDI
jgi:phage tail P2-like protein